MSINKEIPFFKNPDHTHCYQASLKMIAKYYWPEQDYSWEELDKVTAKIKDLWTYPTAGLIWLNDKSVEVKSIEKFDYDRFSEVGAQYLIEVYGEEVGSECIKHTNVGEELKFVEKFKKKIHHEIRTPSLEEIKDLLGDDYIVICAVNSRKLNGRDGFVSHFIVVKGFNEEGFYTNDSGPDDAEENRLVDYKLFESAWAYPDENARNIMAFRKK